MLPRTASNVVLRNVIALTVPSENSQVALLSTVVRSKLSLALAPSRTATPVETAQVLLVNCVLLAFANSNAVAPASPRLWRMVLL
jgi:hypothetical protein